MSIFSAVSIVIVVVVYDMMVIQYLDAENEYPVSSNLNWLFIYSISMEQRGSGKIWTLKNFKETEMTFSQLNGEKCSSLNVDVF